MDQVRPDLGDVQSNRSVNRIYSDHLNLGKKIFQYGDDKKYKFKAICDSKVYAKEATSQLSEL